MLEKLKLSFINFGYSFENVLKFLTILVKILN